MPTPHVSFPVTRLQPGQAAEPFHDELAVEEPLEIRVWGRSVAITMRTPGHDEELAAGFLLTEGIIANYDDLLEIKQCPAPNQSGLPGNVVDILLSRSTTVDFSRLTRHVFSASSCGLCGKATIESVHQRFPPVRKTALASAAQLLNAPAQLCQAQATFQRTGGLHATGLFAADGHLVVAREDVGRHNAVDKVLGHALLRRSPALDHHLLLVSGRVSFEIMQKALAARIPVVAGLSAPTSLAVDFAQQSGQTLVGFLREGRMNVYTGKVI